MTNDDRIDIHDPIFEIIHRLGLEPNFVKELVFTPRTVTATVYLKNENGSKYTVPADELLPSDNEDEDATGFSTTPAVETRTFEITTTAP